MTVVGARDAITNVVLSWDGMAAAPHRFGGTEYRLGTREIGHIHDDHMLDIPFSKKVRDAVVAAGRAEPHHLLPETGWISFYLRQPADVDRAIALLSDSYEIARQQKSRRATETQDIQDVRRKIMKIAVFGATGGTGKQVVQQALAAGDQVTALVRDPAKLAVDSASLTVVTGNVLDAAKVEGTLQGADAVVVSLGNTDSNPDYVVSQGTQVIVDTMKRLGQPKRIVIVSSLGVGESKDQVSFTFKMLMGTVLRKPMEDKERQEALVKASDLDWTIVRPGGLTDSPATGNYKSGLDPEIGAGQVSRADVAAFVLKQLTDSTYLHKAPAIS